MTANKFRNLQNFLIRNKKQKFEIWKHFSKRNVSLKFIAKLGFFEELIFWSKISIILKYKGKKKSSDFSRNKFFIWKNLKFTRKFPI